MGGSSSTKADRNRRRIWRRRPNDGLFCWPDISMDETHLCVLDREGVLIHESKTASAAEAIADRHWRCQSRRRACRNDGHRLRRGLHPCRRRASAPAAGPASVASATATIDNAVVMLRERSPSSKSIEKMEAFHQSDERPKTREACANAESANASRSCAGALVINGPR